MSVTSMVESRRLAATFGVELNGLDLRAATDELRQYVVGELHRHRVVCIRNQKLDAGQLLEFSRAFGTPVAHFSTRYNVEGRPEVTRISNIFEDGEPIGVYDGDEEFEWHADSSWKPRLNTVTMLQSVVAPEDQGETWFADTTQAFDELNSETKERISDVKAVHSLEYLTEQQRAAVPGKPALTDEERRANPDTEQPLVLTHPVTGRKSLLVGSAIIRNVVGASEVESNALLQELMSAATKKELVYKHKWREGDLVIWDNLAVMHTATPCDRHRNQRLLHRVTVL